MLAKACPKKRPRLCAGLLCFVLFTLAGVAGSLAREPTDDEFIESLGDVTNTEPVDRRRLAKILFSFAATLDGGKSTVQLLQSKAAVPETSRQAVRSLLETRFAEYERALAGFKGSVSELLDQPESMLVLYRALVDGQRACWLLDVQNRLVETYGTATMDLISVLASREACARLRTAAFQPRVAGIIQDALVEQVYQREEIRRLREELKDLELLFGDLHRIDGSRSGSSGTQGP